MNTEPTSCSFYDLSIDHAFFNNIPKGEEASGADLLDLEALTCNTSTHVQVSFSSSSNPQNCIICYDHTSDSD